MEKRVLGKSGLEVSALGFGCMGLNFAYGKGLNRQRRYSAMRSKKVIPFSIQQRLMGRLPMKKLLERR
nr:hypothetical protein [Dyadobacter sp. CY261]